MSSFIYLIDDEPSLVWVVKQFLHMQGYKVEASLRGEDALMEMEKQAPDLVLLDILMPDMDGFTVLRRMRAMPALLTVPVIFLTAKGELPAVLAGFDLGADDYVVKPFDLEELELRIQAILRRSATTSSTPQPRLDNTRYVLNVHGREVHLTPSESMVVGYLLDHLDQLVSSEELLHKALGYAEDTGNLGTVRYHIRNLRGKLTRAGIVTIGIETVGHSGYVMSLL